MFNDQENQLHQLVLRYQYLEADYSTEARLERNAIIRAISWIPQRHSARFRKYTLNGEDVEQDAQLALLLAIKTWSPRAPFLWWAEQYIKLKVSRSANKHSAFKIPIGKARLLKPLKVEMEEASAVPGYLSEIEWQEMWDRFAESLTDQEKQVVAQGITGYSTTDISQQLGISKTQVRNLAKSGKQKLQVQATESLN